MPCLTLNDSAKSKTVFLLDVINNIFLDSNEKIFSANQETLESIFVQFSKASTSSGVNCNLIG